MNFNRNRYSSVHLLDRGKMIPRGVTRALRTGMSLEPLANKQDRARWLFDHEAIAPYPYQFNLLRY
jgi:hypothetical protein